MIADGTLSRVYEQRIAVAVQSALAGHEVTFLVDGSDDTAYLTYRDPRRHVIASGSERGMRELLPRAEAEFARQLRAAKAAGSF